MRKKWRLEKEEEEGSARMEKEEGLREWWDSKKHWSDI